MEIEYKGSNCLIFTSKTDRLVSDPKLSGVGLKDVVVTGSIELVTEERFMIEDPDARLIINSPGEYEIGDWMVNGIAASRHIDADTSAEATIYRLVNGDIRLALIGNIGPKLSDDQLEALGLVDILVVPVGGGGLTLDATSAVGLVRQVEPKVVIPIHYEDNGINYEVPQDSLDKFINELAAPVDRVGGKYKIKAPAVLPATLTTVVIDRT